MPRSRALFDTDADWQRQVCAQLGEPDNRTFDVLANACPGGLALVAARDPIRDHYFEANLFRSRAIVAALVCAALLLLLAVRLFFLQGVGHSHYATLSTSGLRILPGCTRQTLIGES